ncbi:MAG: type II toxin-antitoxin system RelE/ParE family toxin [Dehalococcoidia bacterium]
MRVQFASKYLQRWYEDTSAGMRAWGADVGRRYIQRIDALFGVHNFAELYSVRAFRLHQLKGEREGQHAMTLVGRWRLILTYLPSEQAIRVEEVANHYDD